MHLPLLRYGIDSAEFAVLRCLQDKLRAMSRLRCFDSGEDHYHLQELRQASNPEIKTLNGYGEKNSTFAVEHVMKADFTIDCVGLYCPMPIANAAKQIKRMKTGEVLEIVADDDGVKLDMPSWAKMTGNEFLGIENVDGTYHVFVRKA